jgi:hypothetical protein
MAVIHTKGLLEGRRLRRCRPRSRLFWPVLFAMSNAYCRLELDLDLLAEKLLTFSDMAPDAAQVNEMLLDYQNNHLLFVYENGDQLWGQWDFVSAGDIKKFPTKEEQLCPAPLEPDYTDWLREKHGDDWKLHHSATVAAENTRSWGEKQSALSSKRADAGRRGGLATQANQQNAKQTQASPSNTPASPSNSSLGVGLGFGSGSGSGVGVGVGNGNGTGSGEHSTHTAIQYPIDDLTGDKDQQQSANADKSLQDQKQVKPHPVFDPLTFNEAVETKDGGVYSASEVRIILDYHWQSENDYWRTHLSSALHLANAIDLMSSQVPQEYAKQFRP